jgi:DNA-binding beta-propeller fold protein YncE
MIPKIHKLIALLIGIVTVLFIISIVNAEEITSASSAKITAASPLPSLHFNNSQEKVDVINELSLGKDIHIRTATQKSENKKIPPGAIIHHAKNVTTVFDQNGKQLLRTDDDRAGKISTFRGDQPATFIHEIPSDSVIVDDGNIVYIIFNNTRILTVIDSDSDESYIPGPPGENCAGPPYTTQWIEGVEIPISSGSGVFKIYSSLECPNESS